MTSVAAHLPLLAQSSDSNFGRVDAAHDAREPGPWPSRTTLSGPNIPDIKKDLKSTL